MKRQMKPIASLAQSIAIDSMFLSLQILWKLVGVVLLLVLLVSCAQRPAIAQQETHTVTATAVTLQTHPATAPGQSENSAAKDAAQNPVAAGFTLRIDSSLQ